jgi:undecaprenyl pyrophosphate phosphatase UppP
LALLIAYLASVSVGIRNTDCFDRDGSPEQVAANVVMALVMAVVMVVMAMMMAAAMMMSMAMMMMMMGHILLLLKWGNENNQTKRKLLDTSTSFCKDSL